MKEPHGKVLFQSPVCIAICGDKKEKNCSEECLAKFRWPAGGGVGERWVEQGLQYRPYVEMHGHVCHVALVREGQNNMVVFSPQDQVLQQRLDQLRAWGLSPREMEIAERLLKGWSHQEMVASLHIARSTLKTHINNIRRKTPLDFWETDPA